MILDKILDRIKANPSFGGQYVNALRSLFESGLIDFLKEKSKPASVDNGRDPNMMAFQAARSVGYNEAIEDLIYFSEKYLGDRANLKTPTMDYKGLDIAGAKGDLLPEEIDAIRNNTTVNYSAIAERIRSKANGKADT